jgi:hypothetical protein
MLTGMHAERPERTGTKESGDDGLLPKSSPVPSRSLPDRNHYARCSCAGFQMLPVRSEGVIVELP